MTVSLMSCDREWIESRNDFENSLKSATKELKNVESPWEPKRLAAHVKLRPYQIIGAQWIESLFSLHLNGILADDMGLGKTLQTIAFLGRLSDRFKKGCLIIVPLSLVLNWKNEFESFAPSFQVQVLVGDQARRRIVIQELRDTPFDVLITTYEMVNRELEFLSSRKWDYLVVDEAHRLKNRESLLHRNLLRVDCTQKLLLTGTPIQNNLGELHALLEFCNPSLFNVDVSQFCAWYSDPDSHQCLSEIIRPLILRRMKNEVVILPENKVFVIKAPMTTIQKGLYKSILTKNWDSFQTLQKSGLMNVIMQLRKCTNHPYLFNGIEPEPFTAGEHLIQASGKLIVLDQLLQYLKLRGHRVLLFSQMTHMLDIIQDYLQLRDYTCLRLDGSVRGDDRYEAIKAFQESEVFVFLLSTRAGGVGLNLTAADTVIFYDNDFNPSQDEQAAARVNRIGQSKKTQTIRLICENSVDEIIWRRAQSKLRLSRGILQSCSNTAIKEEWDLKDPTEMMKVLYFGLDQLSTNDSPISIDIASILESPLSPLIPEEIDAENSHDIYYFEGHDYKSDKIAFEKLAPDTVTAADMESTSDLANRLEQSQQKKREKKLAKWKELGYTSKALSPSSFISSESPLIDQESDGCFSLIGDVTKPQMQFGESVAIIAHVVDNSGEWSDSGVFAAINRLDLSISQYYKRAGMKGIKDLDLGSVHLIEVSEKIQVALLVAQKRRDTLDIVSFESALETLSLYAHSQNGSVHFPRTVSVSQSWYQIERIICKWLALKGIPTYVYYFRRSNKRERSVDIERALPDALSGHVYYIFLDEDEDLNLKRQLQRRIYAYGGTVTSILSNHVTHVLHTGLEGGEEFSTSWNGIVIETVEEFIQKLKSR